MRHPALLVAASCLAPALSAQYVRPATQVDAGGAGPSSNPAVSCRGDRSAITYADDGEAGVYVTTSDGRGVAWQTAVRVDHAPSGAFKATNSASVHVVDDETLYACWIDDRSGVRQVYFQRSTDGGSSWQPTDLAVSSSAAPFADVTDWRMAVDAAGGYVAMLFTKEVAPASDLLYLSVSQNGGSSFSPGVVVASTGLDVGAIALAVEGSRAHVAFTEAYAPVVPLYDPWYARFDGASQSAQRALDTPFTGDASAVAVAAADGTVAVAFLERAVVDEVRAAVSQNGGSTWGPGAPWPAAKIGGYVSGVHDADAPDVAVAGGRVVVAWNDDRAFFDEVWATTSVDGGTTWAADSQVSAGGVAPRLVAGAEVPEVGRGGDVVGLSWTDGSDVEGSFSRDFAASWAPERTVSQDTTGVASAPTFAHDELYNNFVHAWLADDTGTEAVYAGGYRPQTLTPSGWVAGPTSASFDLTHFSGDAPLGYVVGTLSPGDFYWRYGPERNLGITFDALTLFTVNDPSHFLCTMDDAGSGSTSPFVLSVPPGYTFYFVGFDWVLDPTKLKFEFSDLVPVSF